MENRISKTKSKINIFGCPCTGVARNNTRVAKPGCANDDDAIAILPDDWVPRHSGPILANYLKQREQDHQKILQDIMKCASKANTDIDVRVRTLAEILLADVNHNQLKMDCVIEKLQKLEVLITQEMHDNALKGIDELRAERVDVLTCFKDEATVLEKERADKVRTILRDKFQRLVTVGHMTPKELLHDFDKRIYEINQQLLSNLRAFTELEAKLLVQLNDSVVHARTALNQLMLGIGVVYRQRESHSALRCPIQESLSKRPPSFVRIRETSIAGSFLGDVEELDACVSRLVDAYRVAVLNVYTGYYSKLDTLEKDLYSHQGIIDPNLATKAELADLQKVIERPLKRLSTFVATEPALASSKIMDMTGADIISMRKSLWSLGDRLQDTYLLLHNAGHLWDNHILRSALAQKLTIAAVEDLLTSNDAIELASEIPINIALEQLRCSADAEKLNQQFEVLRVMLDHTAEMYLQHSEAELGRLEEFMNLPAAMTNLLLSELDLFLEKYPRVVQTPDLTNSPGPPRLPLPRAILQTQLQETALQNWRNGFLESFEGNNSLVPEELRYQAQLWVEERSISLHMRYSLKMISHSIRLERIKAARDARLAELRHHDARLESHLNAVYDLVDNLPVQAAEFGAFDAPYFYPLAKYVDRIQNTINELVNQEPPKPEVKKCTMSSLAIRLPIHRQMFEESLDKAIADFKVHIDHRVQEARISNVRFLANIKLFSEGGRYAAQEAIKTCASLSKASEMLETCSSKASEALHHRRTQLLAYADSQVHPLMRILEGPGKLGTKSTVKPVRQEKKKPPAKKK